MTKAVADVDPLDLRQIDAQRLEQRAGGLESQCVRLAAAFPRLGLELLFAGAVWQCSQFGRNFLVALHHLPVVKLVKIVSLLQSE